MNAQTDGRPAPLATYLAGIDRPTFLRADEEEDLAAAVHALLAAAGPAGATSLRPPPRHRSEGVVGVPWLVLAGLLAGLLAGGGATALVRWLGQG